MSDFPPIPELADVNNQPPDRSSYVEIQKVKRPLVMWAKSAYVYDVPKMKLQNSSATIVNYKDGKGPPDYDLVLRQFWRPVGKSYHRILPGNTVTITVSKTRGISTTVSKSITASLGISEGALSAEVSATFSTSVTTSEETSFTDSVEIDPPADGKVRVWLLWQLVHEIVAMQPDGKQFPRGDRDRPNREANVFGLLGVIGVSGARVNYDDTSWLFPSDIFPAYQKDFPAS
jgi:hypothetical protein